MPPLKVILTQVLSIYDADISKYPWRFRPSPIYKAAVHCGAGILIGEYLPTENSVIAQYSR
ncbi:MAG: hypothetical protein O4965_20045 [Trichodesmium sp. St19_bin1]|nr:hypothetical protein [Trichodesmium sp. St19_bin1]